MGQGWPKRGRDMDKSWGGVGSHIDHGDGVLYGGGVLHGGDRWRHGLSAPPIDKLALWEVGIQWGSLAYMKMKF
jgi:hypothetical protein